jgi:DNA polymerase-3 subunit alpha
MASSLHGHCTFSKLDAYGMPEQIVKRALELGLKGLAITDHANTSSHPKLEMACNKWGKCDVCGEIVDMSPKNEKHVCADPTYQTVKPLYGVELYLNSVKTKRQKKNHITLIAKSLEGYKNMVKLASMAYLDDYFYYLPSVDIEDVFANSEDVIALSGCMNGIASELISMGKMDEAREAIARMAQNIEHFYVELQPLDIRYESGDHTVDSEIINNELIKIAKVLSLQVVATNDAHFIRDDERDLQHFLAMVHRKTNIKKFPNKMTPRARLAGEDDFKEWLKPYSKQVARQALVNQDKICDLVEDFKLPKAAPMRWNNEPDEVRYKTLVQWVNEGWKKRWNNVKCPDSKRYRKQGQYELELIKEKGFYDYFLIVSDMVKWAKANNILVGPARGSAGASEVAWLTEITEIDPIRFNLLFERFLDPSRNDAPDIDLDFQDDRREEVKEYMKRKWGDDKVSNVAGYTLYHDLGLLDDIGRCYNISPAMIKRYKKMLISEGGNLTIEGLLRLIEDIFGCQGVPKGLERMLGQLRGYTVHAAGIVVSSEPLSNITTIMGNSIALDKRDAEYLNLLKIDALSLTTLRVIALALKEIKMSVNQLYALPLDNADVFKGFKKGDMQGIFQYAGSTTRNVLIKALKPYEIDDSDMAELFSVVTDVNTLSRPASLNNGSTNRYTNNIIEDIHPIITKHTKETRGQIIYQEQIMRVLREGGLDWADVTAVRKLMTKHEGREKLEGIKKRFFKFLREIFHNTPEECDIVWGRIGDEGAYGFNIAHCVAYTLIAFYTMWLKVYHPLVFYWANMMVKANDEGLLREFAQTGGKIFEVRFGKSKADWSIDYEKNGIRAGYTTIHGIGDKTAQKLVKLQEDHTDENGDIDIDVSDFPVKAYNALVETGAFNEDDSTHDYLGLGELSKMDDEVPGRTRIIDLCDHDIATLAVRLSSHKVKSLREYYKKNNKDYSEVKNGDKEKYVNMKVYDETGELDVTISRYKMSEPGYDELVSDFNGQDIYEVLVEYNESRNKAYVMTMRKAGNDDIVSY